MTLMILVAKRNRQAKGLGKGASFEASSQGQRETGALCGTNSLLDF